MMSSVEYLGHQISGKGLHPTDKKIKAVQEDVPSPQDITQLKSFLGLINYYARFLPDLSFSLSFSIIYCRRTLHGFGGESILRRKDKADL